MRPPSLGRFALLLLLTAMLGKAAAQECRVEAEPNDTPAEAVELDGLRCLAGDLIDDSQDAWFWTVSEEESRVPWRIEVEGIPGQLTQVDVVKVTFADNGVDVASAERLTRFGTRDGRLATSDPFLLGAGRYLLGISKSGGAGEYVVHLRGDEERYGRFEDLARDRDRDGAFGLIGSVPETREFAWTLSDEDAGFRWSLSVRDGVADQTRVTLVGPDGEEIVSGATGNAGATFAELGLSPGRHRIRLEGPSEIVAVEAVRRGRLTDGNEVEPNDDWNRANVLSLDAPLTGVADGRDRYLFEVDEAAAQGALNLVLESDDLVEVTLHDAQGDVLLQRRGHSGRLRNLVLAEGSYGLTIGRGDGGAYSLRFEPSEVPDEGFESEPNDRLVAASSLTDELTVRGELSAQDEDVFRFEVEGDPQLWRVQAVGQGLRGISTYDGGGSEQASLEGTGRLRLDNLVFLPGTNYVRLAGEGEYAMRVIALGPAPEPPEPDPAAAEAELEPAAPPASPEADGADGADPADPEALEAAADPGPPPPAGTLELEPNDDGTRAELLTAGRTRVGVLSNRDDLDTYRFFLANDAYVRIEAVPAADGTLAFDTTMAPRALAGDAGEPAVLERRLVAGDYTVELWAPEPSDGFYQLRLRHVDPLAVPVDYEPNDAIEEARPLPSDLLVEGRVGEMSDDDVYVLPVFDAATEMRIDGTSDAALDLFGAGGRLEHDRENGTYAATIPAGARTHLRIRGRGDYRLAFTFDAEPDPSQLRVPDVAGGLSLSLDEADRSLTAFWHQGQRIDGELVVANASDRARDVRLEAVTSDFAFAVELDEAVRVEPGGTARVPFEVAAPDDVRDDQPVRVSFAARDDAGVASARLTLTPRCEAPPADPFRYWSVPDPLLGDLNVGWAPLGAEIVGATGDNGLYVHDGYTSPGRGLFRAFGEAVTLDLPGDEPFRLTGTLLHPQSRNIPRQLSEFEIATSLDGTTFTPVLRDRLAAPRLEQAFAFDAPVEARYVRLTFLDSVDGGNGAWVGEWKVLAEETAALPAFDLADPRLGGFQVWSDPLLPENALLPGDPRHPSFDGRDLEEAVWTIGFHHGRTAQIARLEWIESDRAVPERFFGKAVVEASLAGPVGPWKEVADWTLERDADGKATLAFEEPVWARYLRFRASGHDPEVDRVYAPEELHVIERAPGDGYRSILGAWGHYASVGPYEALHGSEAATAGGDFEVEADDNDAADDAQPLASGASVRGSVTVAEDEDWFRLTIPEGENVLEVRLAGDPSIGYRYALTDANGEPVVHDVQEEGEAVTLRVFGEPGDYLLHLEEPKRSVVFSWDTSGSVGPYEAITYASVTRFAREIDPRREFVQMLAFDDPDPLWLLPYWSGDPERATRALNEFDRSRADSSAAELAMLTAVRALAAREGTRAALFITDHESGSYDFTDEVWREIEASRPRLFTFEISTGGSGITQDRMQAYAAANRGHYDYARNVGDFDVGFARASCHLRRPKGYEVRIATRYQEPPGPGTLSVVRGENAARPAVEVIFDASGSMGAPLPDGEPRIDAAKRVLESLVGEILPDGTPFALRAFGHVTPSSCETRLDVPLAPLDREAAGAAVADIQPKLLSQTPIADSLAQVPNDLAEAGGGRVVILITDGEESCDGDPEAVLRDLQAQGVTVQLSIVSLALDEAEARERFASLAEVAGGVYTDVQDADALRASVEEALYPPFEVLGPAGDVLARGRVGVEPVEVPMGVYAVRVPGSPLVRDVRVPGDGSVAVTIGGE